MQVHTGEYGIASSEPLHTHVSQCTAVAVFSPGLVGLAHIHPNNNREELLEELFSQVQGEIQLAGGCDLYWPVHIPGKWNADRIVSWLQTRDLEIARADLYSDFTRDVYAHPTEGIKIERY